MRKIFSLLVFTFLLGCAKYERFVNVAERSLPKTVKLSVYTDLPGPIFGSGVFISDRGHILTAAHLFEISRNKKITVVAYKIEKEYEGLLLFKSTVYDLALIKIDAYTPSYAKLPPYYGVTIGQEIIAIGHPLELDWSVTHGIISQQREDKDRVYIQWNQTDASVNPGNSGGPLFNLSGQLVGINSHGYSMSVFPVSTGLNMAASNQSIAKFLYVFEGLQK